VFESSKIILSESSFFDKELESQKNLKIYFEIYISLVQFSLLNIETFFMLYFGSNSFCQNTYGPEVIILESFVLPDNIFSICDFLTIGIAKESKSNTSAFFDTNSI